MNLVLTECFLGANGSRYKTESILIPFLPRLDCEENETLQCQVVRPILNESSASWLCFLRLLTRMKGFNKVHLPLPSNSSSSALVFDLSVSSI